MKQLMLFVKSMKEYCMPDNGTLCLSATDNRFYFLHDSHMCLSVYRYVVCGRFNRNDFFLINL